MRSHAQKIDRFFLFSVVALTVAGFIIFLSASLGLLAQGGASFGTVATKQGVSLIIGIIFFLIFSRVKYDWWRKMALIVFVLAILINIIVFIPGISMEHGGATRWIEIGFLSFQPSEFLKLALIIYIAAWARFVKDKIKTFKYGFVPYIAIVAILSAVLLSQRDTDTLVIVCSTGLVMFVIAGLRLRYLIISVILMVIMLLGVLYFRPYTLDRVKTYLNKNTDTQGASYQINQSLIAIGSGGLYGRGFGQSIQKFGYLPEPIGDSVFAVAAEEFGFVGGGILLILYVFLGISSFRIGIKSTDIFASLLVIGIATLIITESFMNIAAMLGLIPLSGLPLLFVSHGGTALVIVLSEAGIVANVSKYASKHRE